MTPTTSFAIAIAGRETGSANSAVTVPSTNSRPKSQLRATPNASSPPAAVICSTTPMSPPQPSTPASGPSFAITCSSPDAAARSIPSESAPTPSTSSAVTETMTRDAAALLASTVIAARSPAFMRPFRKPSRRRRP